MIEDWNPAVSDPQRLIGESICGSPDIGAFRSMSIGVRESNIPLIGDPQQAVNGGGVLTVEEVTRILNAAKAGDTATPRVIETQTLRRGKWVPSLVAFAALGGLIGVKYWDDQRDARSAAEDIAVSPTATVPSAGPNQSGDLRGLRATSAPFTSAEGTFTQTGCKQEVTLFSGNIYTQNEIEGNLCWELSAEPALAELGKLFLTVWEVGPYGDIAPDLTRDKFDIGRNKGGETRGLSPDELGVFISEFIVKEPNETITLMLRTRPNENGEQYSLGEVILSPNEPSPVSPQQPIPTIAVGNESGGA